MRGVRVGMEVVGRDRGKGGMEDREGDKEEDRDKGGGEPRVLGGRRVRARGGWAS